MKQWLLVVIVPLLCFYPLSSFGSNKVCSELFHSNYLASQVKGLLQKNCLGGGLCGSEDVIKITDDILQTRFPKMKNLKAYTAIISIMVGTAGVGAVLTSNVAAQHQSLAMFISTIVGSITTIGVYVVGSPLWESFQPRLRQMTYKMIKSNSWFGLLENQYLRTSQTLSVNEQMARNVISDYNRMVNDGLSLAKNSYSRGLTDFSIFQIAALIYRLDQLYPDVDPLSPLVVSLVHSLFPSDYMHSHKALKLKVFNYLQENKVYPEQKHLDILQAWFPSRQWDVVE